VRAMGKKKKKKKKSIVLRLKTWAMKRMALRGANEINVFTANVRALAIRAFVDLI
jgi:hypothetical protein